ncbi:MAG: HutD family protein [Oscillospiraceae bacterium]|nr:HutD family protein [Oscillospiraceae bacterium]
MLNITRLTAADYATSQWSGGSTTQMAIEPATAVYADRDFLWRLSSATVELAESLFTALPDYNRLIATLSAPIDLSHDGGERFALEPYAVHAFDGGAETRSWGQCVDFNLMLRKGAAAGAARAVCGGESYVPVGDTAAEGHVLYLYCVEGSGELAVGEERTTVAAGETLVIRGLQDETLCLGGTLRCMAAEAWLVKKP